MNTASAKAIRLERCRRRETAQRDMTSDRRRRERAEGLSACSGASGYAYVGTYIRLVCQLNGNAAHLRTGSTDSRRRRLRLARTKVPRRVGRTRTRGRCRACLRAIPGRRARPRPHKLSRRPRAREVESTSEEREEAIRTISPCSAPGCPAPTPALVPGTVPSLSTCVLQPRGVGSRRIDNEKRGKREGEGRKMQE